MLYYIITISILLIYDYYIVDEIPEKTKDSINAINNNDANNYKINLFKIFIVYISGAIIRYILYYLFGIL